MKYAEVPCVIDADGLNLLADHMELLPKEKKAICTDTTYERNGRTFGVYHPGTWEKTDLLR